MASLIVVTAIPSMKLNISFSRMDSSFFFFYFFLLVRLMASNISKGLNPFKYMKLEYSGKS